MLKPVTTNQFEKDLNKAKKQGKDLEKLKEVMSLLLNQTPLPPNNKDHKLSGNYSHHRECHLSPDWLLIYKATKVAIIFERMGSHSELFKK